MENNIPMDEVAEWLAHPTTKKIKAIFSAARKHHVEALVSGAFCASLDPGKTAMTGAREVGYIAGLDEFLGIEITDEIESLR